MSRRSMLLKSCGNALVTAMLAAAAAPCHAAAGKPPFAFHAGEGIMPHQVPGGRGANDNVAGGGISPVEVLSDTEGVNFNPYLHRILRTIYDEWMTTIPDNARPPRRLAGETMIRFSILPNGRVSAMHLDGSTHDDALNRAAWSAITRVGDFPALPEQFHGPNLELRIRFKVDEQSDGVPGAN